MLGSLEYRVLVNVWSLGDNAYGPVIAGDDLLLSSVYIVLRRLESKGLVESRWGGITKTTGGRSKRYYKLTDAGVTAVSNADKWFLQGR